MNTRSLINFFKSPVGKMLGFFILLALGVLATNFLPKEGNRKKRVNEKELSEIEIQKDFKKFRDNFKTTKVINKNKIQQI